MQQQEAVPQESEQKQLPPSQQQELQAIVWQNGKLSTDIPLEKLPEILPDPHRLIWLDIVGDCSDYESKLCDVFKLEPIIIKTMGEEQERAKFLERDDYVYLVVHGMTFDPATEVAVTPKLDIVFAKNYIITSHRVSFDWLDKLQKEAMEKDSGEHIMGRGMPFLLYNMLDALVDSYFPVLDDIDDIIDDLEDEAVKSASNDVQVHIFRMKRTLGQMRRVISPQIEVANALVARTGKLIPAKAEPYFADVHDHLVRILQEPQAAARSGRNRGHRGRHRARPGGGRFRDERQRRQPDRPHPVVPRRLDDVQPVRGAGAEEARAACQHGELEKRVKIDHIERTLSSPSPRCEFILEWNSGSVAFYA